MRHKCTRHVCGATSSHPHPAHFKTLLLAIADPKVNSVESALRFYTRVQVSQLKCALCMQCCAIVLLVRRTVAASCGFPMLLPEKLTFACL